MKLQHPALSVFEISVNHHQFLSQYCSRDRDSLVQPGGGHPLRHSVQLVYQPTQLVKSLVWVCVHNGRIKEVAETVLHLPRLFNDLLHFIRLCKKES